jgi:hypothetical protein
MSDTYGIGRERKAAPADAADFLHEALTELLQIARNHRLDMLCYRIDMARLASQVTFKAWFRHVLR